jgi:hypothetical protein
MCNYRQASAHLAARCSIAPFGFMPQNYNWFCQHLQKGATKNRVKQIDQIHIQGFRARKNICIFAIKIKLC